MPSGPEPTEPTGLFGFDWYPAIRRHRSGQTEIEACAGSQNQPFFPQSERTGPLVSGRPHSTARVFPGGPALRTVTRLGRGRREPEIMMNPAMSLEALWTNLKIMNAASGLFRVRPVNQAARSRSTVTVPRTRCHGQQKEQLMLGGYGCGCRRSCPGRRTVPGHSPGIRQAAESTRCQQKPSDSDNVKVGLS
jgi:hypothetical protein